MNKLELSIHYTIKNQKAVPFVLPSLNLKKKSTVFNKRKLVYGDIYVSTFSYCCYIILTESKRNDLTNEELFNHFTLLLFNKEVFTVITDKPDNIKKFYNSHINKDKEFLYLGNYYLDEIEEIDYELNNFYKKYDVKATNRNKIHLKNTYSEFKEYLKEEFAKMMELKFYDVNTSNDFQLKQILENNYIFNELKEKKLCYFIKLICILNFSNSNIDKYPIVGNECSNYKIIKNNEIIHNYYMCLDEYGSVTLFDVNKCDLLNNELESKKIIRLEKAIKNKNSNISISLPNERDLQEIIHLIG